MTNEELFAGLKQLIEATVSQQQADVATKADLAALLDAVQDAIGAERAIVNLDNRITRLEQLFFVALRTAGPEQRP